MKVHILLKDSITDSLSNCSESEVTAFAQKFGVASLDARQKKRLIRHGILTSEINENDLSRIAEMIEVENLELDGKQFAL